MDTQERASFEYRQRERAESRFDDEWDYLMAMNALKVTVRVAAEKLVAKDTILPYKVLCAKISEPYSDKELSSQVSALQKKILNDLQADLDGSDILKII